VARARAELGEKSGSGGMSAELPSPAHTPVAVSFEFFPPKTPEMETQLWNAIRRLAPLRPAFVSVTYGAGGSTRDRTHATVKRLVEETELRPAAHLTCVGATRKEVDDVVRDYWAAGVRHIVALRGDMPEPGQAYRGHPEGYQSTAELVAAIRAIAPFEVSVSAYPEKHPDSPSLEADIETLKAKIDAGAARAITQFAFDNDEILRLRDRAQRAGIGVPIVPGLMPTTNFKGVKRMAGRCGASVPAWLAELYDGLDDDVESRKLIASAVLTEQVQKLRGHGFAQFHFYTLNQAELTFAVCNMLGIKPAKKTVPA
jgi:methylenetetrahydrofolate reductase (NADPH)